MLIVANPQSRLRNACAFYSLLTRPTQHNTRYTQEIHDYNTIDLRIPREQLEYLQPVLSSSIPAGTLTTMIPTHRQHNEQKTPRLRDFGMSKLHHTTHAFHYTSHSKPLQRKKDHIPAYCCTLDNSGYIDQDVVETFNQLHTVATCHSLQPWLLF